MALWEAGGGGAPGERARGTKVIMPRNKKIPAGRLCREFSGG